MPSLPALRRRPALPVSPTLLAVSGHTLAVATPAAPPGSDPGGPPPPPHRGPEPFGRRLRERFTRLPGTGTAGAPRTAAAPATPGAPGTAAAPGAPLTKAPATPGPPSRPRPPGRTGYLALLRLPGAAAFTLGGLLARLPAGMFSVSAVLMIAASRGSYALAGAVTATGLAATALVAPWTARLVDRYGQRRVARPATALAACGALALVACVRLDAPAWTLFAAYAATATVPNAGAMARARWQALLGEDPARRHTATSFEQAVDEVCFMLGPALAAVLCAALFPEAGTLTGVALLVGGMALFTAQRATEPRPHPRTADGRTASLRRPGAAPLLAVFFATGAVFGALEVTTLAFADAGGHAAAGGLIVGLQAAGSCVAGLVYGARAPLGPAAARLPALLALLAAALVVPALAATTGSPALLAPAVLCAGMATAPVMITAMTLVQHHTPPSRLNEGLTLAVTAILTGIATGAALAGQTADHLPPGTGYTIALAAASLAIPLAAHARTRTPKPTPTQAAAPAPPATPGSATAPGSTATPSPAAHFSPPSA
ncbi:MFS transporter [Streptomyces sp. NPDC058374]|uniref:MFS transporter n=1 Tax=Streptomyces sp. NPDC058374 TaxID=3346466 RepID=UPI003647ED72